MFPLLLVVLLGGAIAFAATREGGALGPFTDSTCTKLADDEQVEAWLAEATAAALAARDIDPMPVTLDMDRLMAIPKIRVYMVAGWGETGVECPPMGTAASTEAWRLLGCSVVLALAEAGLIDEEPEDVVHLCELDATLISFLPTADEVLPEGPVVEPPKPEPEPAPSIPYGDGWVWELFLDDDGVLRDEEGQTWEPMEAEVDVCEGDTIILHTPPGLVDVLPVDSLPWIEEEVYSPEHGLFVWHVHLEPEDIGGITQTGVHVWTDAADDYVQYGFSLFAQEPEDCIPIDDAA